MFDSCHALSKLHGLQSNFKEALTLERKAYQIYRSAHGDQHPRTAAAASALSQWTTLAVEAAKRAKELAMVGPSKGFLLGVCLCCDSCRCDSLSKSNTIGPT